jgi:hypothetical protein
VLYGNPVRIFLARGEGEFRVPRVWLTDLDEEDGGDGDPLASPAADARPEDYIELTGDRATDDAIIMRALRSACGVAKGCPIATFGACLSLHISFHRLQKLFTLLKIVCVADDAYYSAPAEILYSAFDRVRADQLHDLNLRSNMKKVKAINPLGGAADIPSEILAKQGGELAGFRWCRGIRCAAYPRG